MLWWEFIWEFDKTKVNELNINLYKILYPNIMLFPSDSLNSQIMQWKFLTIVLRLIIHI